MKNKKFLLIMPIFICLLLVSNCKNQEEDPCSRVSVNSSGNVSVSDCGSGGVMYSNITYNSFGHRTGYDFTVTCSTGGTFSGHVTLTYDFGRSNIVSKSLTVNGIKCF